MNQLNLEILKCIHQVSYLKPDFKKKKKKISNFWNLRITLRKQIQLL